MAFLPIDQAAHTATTTAIVATEIAHNVCDGTDVLPFERERRVPHWGNGVKGHLLFLEGHSLLTWSGMSRVFSPLFVKGVQGLSETLPSIWPIPHMS